MFLIPKLQSLRLWDSGASVFLMFLMFLIDLKTLKTLIPRRGLCF